MHVQKLRIGELRHFIEEAGTRVPCYSAAVSWFSDSSFGLEVERFGEVFYQGHYQESWPYSAAVMAYRDLHRQNLDFRRDGMRGHVVYYSDCDNEILDPTNPLTFEMEEQLLAAYQGLLISRGHSPKAVLPVGDHARLPQRLLDIAIVADHYREISSFGQCSIDCTASAQFLLTVDPPHKPWTILSRGEDPLYEFGQWLQMVQVLLWQCAKGVLLEQVLTPLSDGRLVPLSTVLPLLAKVEK